MTFEEFLVAPDVPEFAEWVDGEVVLMAAVENRHGEVAQFVSLVFGVYVDATGLGAVRFEPFQMKLPRSSRAPDVMYIGADRLDRIERLYLDGPATIAVEVVSLGSRRTDKVLKRNEYERGGVPEYLWIDPIEKRSALHRLGADGRYEIVFDGRVGEFGLEGLNGVRFRAEWFWQSPPPSTMKILRDQGILQ